MRRLLSYLYIVTIILTPNLKAQQQPYGGTYWQIPGTVEAENYDQGGENIAYHDSDLGNSGSQFRNEDVDIEACSEGGYNVGWMITGEWIEYSIDVTMPGKYKLRVRAASALDGGRIQFSFNSENVTETQTVPNTGGWQNWVWIDFPEIQLDSGKQILRMIVDNTGYNINYLLFEKEQDTESPNLPDGPDYSHKHGFYDSPFDLTVSWKDEGSIIVYTLDGSDPRTNPSAYEAPSPVTILVDPASTNGRPATPGVTVRAYARLNGTPVTNTGSSTYIFIEKVKTQKYPGGEWPQDMVNSKYIDYNMDPYVINDSRYKDLIKESLLDIPTICISTDVKNLFDPTTGIYVNPTGRGMNWERPISIELIDPKNNEEGFQVNAGLRIRGGYSRIGDQPKHALRFFFREQYGKAKLKYPLFGNEGVSEFDCVDLRTAQNYSWSYMSYSGHVCIFTRELFSRDCQRDMGQPYTRSRPYHLYINGMYWGLYQTQERSEASYAESYLGGNKEDYDVVKVDVTTGNTIEATDGKIDDYNQLWTYANAGFSKNDAYFKVQGKNSDGSINMDYPVLINLDNLIDYMLVIFYTGNFDSPITAFGSNQTPNNFYGIRNRLDRSGFIFFSHDAEHSLMDPNFSENEDYGRDRTGPYPCGSSVQYFNPQWLHQQLAKNTEYKMLFADHVYKRFFNNGVLTPKASQQRLAARSDEIDMAVIAESARWGDSKVDRARTKDDDWEPAVSWLMNSYFPTRTNTVLGQLKSKTWYPSIDPPKFFTDTQEIQDNILSVNPGSKIKIVNNNASQTGTIYYTLDGSDPRIIGGTVNQTAIEAGDEIELAINSNTIIKTRVKNNDTWSAIHEIQLNTGEITSGLTITEINYNPLPDNNISGSEFEFIELKNTGSSPIYLAGDHFIKGIEYTFPDSSKILPNNFVVLASNAAMFYKRYGFAPTAEYNRQLDNKGERIVLVNALGDTLISASYNDKSPWPEEADSAGYTLVAVNTNGCGDPSTSEYWRASSKVNGSPGTDDSASGVEDNIGQKPLSYYLNQNYPNPFNPETVIKYEIPVLSKVELKVFDILGREIETIVDKVQSAGIYEIKFNAGKLSSGIYLYRIKAGDFIKTNKMVLMR